MRISVSEAKGQLLDLVRRAEAGEEVILTRHGAEVVRLVPAVTRPSAAQRRLLLEEMFGKAGDPDGLSAARSQDFLYDDEGIPQ
ncbi:MAG: type II toxin-antitoxin system prevent-host-death family antitoxin [Azospirillaceae bacterium]|nr:type II toxin-antitoxin system prevent-host-death family antitoxin [Azospirillaceae bacterium]